VIQPVTNDANEREDGGDGRRRIALFGGIYSNHLALAEALADARRRRVDAVYCLGDLGAFGPCPNRVFPLLREGGVETLAGNYDDSLARGLGDCQCGYTDPRDNYFARLSYAYTFRKTSPANKAWLATLPREIRLELAGREVLLCHGSPRRQNEFLWESTTPDHFLEKLCADHGADVIVATHTGIKWARELPSGRLFVNCGVLGRPENDGTTRVWYAILEGAPGERLRVEFVPVEYDWRALAREMREEALPEDFVATIETGWWTTCLEVLPAKERLRGRY
jgi:diadenosine tetraphosphatase ApaH/serine/threonine PP2A family protein phosphatase